MKKLLVLSLILVSFITNAQLREVTPLNKLGEVKRGGYFITNITYVEKGSYILSYWDASYRTIDVINNISFTATDEELVTLKKLFKNQCSAEKKSEKSFGLGNNTIKLVTERAFGNSGLVVYVASGNKVGFFHINEKELESLFGNIK
jgi:hypothetical protein